MKMKKKQQKRLKNIAEECKKVLNTLSPSAAPKNEIPQEMLLGRNTPGVFFGSLDNSWKSQYVGMRQGTDGHIMVIGGSGSGKSSGIAKPTLQTWKGAIFALDVKGELSDCYGYLYRQKLVERPYIVIDFTDIEGPSYDPFQWLSQDGNDNLFANIKELVFSIIKNNPNAQEPFWTESEQALLQAALLHCYQLGLSFSESMSRITDDNVDSLCEELAKSTDILVKRILGELGEMEAANSQMLYGIARGFRNKNLPFATDVYVAHAFRGAREGAKCVTFDDLQEYNIFFRISENKIEILDSAVNLILAQLIQYFERRPDKYSPQGKKTVDTLLLLDEFPRFGKLEMIADAVSTLRSKKVNLCFVIQSFAQLDGVYGECARKIISDNCNYKVILGANDADTQRYLADSIGTYVHPKFSISQQLSEDLKPTGFNIEASEVRDYVIQPHDLASLKDVIILSPFGYCRVQKCMLHNDNNLNQILNMNTGEMNIAKSIYYKRNINAQKLSLEERSENAQAKIKKAAEEVKKQREANRQAQEEEKKRVQRNNFAVGNVVVPYLPALTGIEPEDMIETDNDYEIFEEAQPKDGAKKRCVADRQARKAKRKDIQRTVYAVGEVATSYIPQILGFQPEAEIKSGDCLKILDNVMSELVANPENLSDLRKKASVFGDRLIILDVMLNELVSAQEFLCKIRKKAIDIVIIENFFNEIRAKTEIGSEEIKQE